MAFTLMMVVFYVVLMATVVLFLRGAQQKDGDSSGW
jgi:hypothetical protein